LLIKKLAVRRAFFCFKNFSVFINIYIDILITINGNEEDRHIAIGFANKPPMIVSFSESNIQIIRIISARRAKKHEMEAFYHEKNGFVLNQ